MARILGYLRVVCAQTNVMKFSYLKGALRGSAALAITGISVTNENYDVAIRIL